MKQLIHKTRSGYDSRNKCSSNRFLKMSRDGAEVTSAGRSFHKREPVRGKARCPIVGSLTTGAHSSSEVEGRNLCRDGMSAIDVNCRKYCGASPCIEGHLEGHRPIGQNGDLESNPFGHSQPVDWRLTSASVMWSDRRRRNTSRVAAFWTDWSRRTR